MLFVVTNSFIFGTYITELISFPLMKSIILQSSKRDFGDKYAIKNPESENNYLKVAIPIVLYAENQASYIESLFVHGQHEKPRFLKQMIRAACGCSHFYFKLAKQMVCYTPYGFTFRHLWMVIRTSDIKLQLSCIGLNMVMNTSAELLARDYQNAATELAASMLLAFVISPIRVIQTRLAQQILFQKTDYSTPIGCIEELRSEGLSSFFSGSVYASIQYGIRNILSRRIMVQLAKMHLYFKTKFSPIVADVAAVASSLMLSALTAYIVTTGSRYIGI